MDILRQCQKWHEENKFRKIVDAIEALDDDHRSGELDLELARALNNLASFEDEPELYRKAVEALERCQDELENTHLWQFRMGYARYYMDQDGWALDHFRKALELLGLMILSSGLRITAISLLSVNTVPPCRHSTSALPSVYVLPGMSLFR